MEGFGMPKLIISGRGGSGKSTLVTLIAHTLKEQKKRVLVVDSDESNIGLSGILGIEPAEKTLMDYLGGKPRVMKKLRSMIRDGETEPELFREKFDLESLSQEFVCWVGSLGLMQIGKIDYAMEGCACPMGAVTRDFLNHVRLEEDQWVLVDTEAGVEHFGRGIVEGADAVVMVVDPSSDAVLLAEKAAKLTHEADKRFGVILNKIDEETEPILTELLTSEGNEIKGVLPYSPAITKMNLKGESLGAYAVKNEVDEIIRELMKC